MVHMAKMPSTYQAKQRARICYGASFPIFEPETPFRSRLERDGFSLAICFAPPASFSGPKKCAPLTIPSSQFPLTRRFRRYPFFLPSPVFPLSARFRRRIQIWV
jgi:hypothetical protein